MASKKRPTIGAATAIKKAANPEMPARKRRAKNGTATRPDRVGRVPLMGYFPPLAKVNMRTILAMPSELDKNQQDLLFEALNLLFSKHGLPEMEIEDGEELNALEPSE